VPPQNTQNVRGFTTRNPSLPNETYVCLGYKSIARQQISISSKQFPPPSLSSRLLILLRILLLPVADRPPACSPFRQWSAYPIPSSGITNDTRSYIALAASRDGRQNVSSGEARCLGRTADAARIFTGESAGGESCGGEDGAAATAGFGFQFAEEHRSDPWC
jgi:hypothetical protein